MSDVEPFTSPLHPRVCVGDSPAGGWPLTPEPPCCPLQVTGRYSSWQPVSEITFSGGTGHLSHVGDPGSLRSHMASFGESKLWLAAAAGSQQLRARQGSCSVHSCVGGGEGPRELSLLTVSRECAKVSVSGFQAGWPSAGRRSNYGNSGAHCWQRWFRSPVGSRACSPR